MRVSIARIGIISAFKVGCLLYLAPFVCIVLMLVASFLFGGLTAKGVPVPASIVSSLTGGSLLSVSVLFYGLFGGIIAGLVVALYALFYNIIARVVGGLEIDLIRLSIAPVRQKPEPAEPTMKQDPVKQQIKERLDRASYFAERE